MVMLSTSRRGDATIQHRLLLGGWGIALVFVVLGWRLFSLQILRGEELASRGRQNFVQRVEVLHDRGIIYDRKGQILVDNRPSLNVTVTPHFLGNRDAQEASLTKLASHLALTPEQLHHIREQIESKRGLDRFVPITVRRDIEPAQVDAIEADRSIFLLDGVQVTEGRKRTYPHGKVASHLLGYMNEIGPGRLRNERKKGNPHFYERGDMLGAAGLERVYETQLRGVDGYEKVVVDAKGRRLHGAYVETLLGDDRSIAPEPGKNIFLTIDLDLQHVAETAFTGRAGAVVAINPQNGALLALASFPAIDPNRVASEKDRNDSDPLSPWLDRALQGQYAPGSTFKLVTALAALKTNAVSFTEKIKCPGWFRFGRRTWRCHRKAGHGMVDLTRAIQVSCDTYFYTLAARMGIDPIAAMGETLGLGTRTGFVLGREQPGLMPDEAFHDRVDHATGGYQRGMAINTAIGQGSVLVTPLQLARAFAVQANRGTLVVPQVVMRIETPDFRIVTQSLMGQAIHNEITTGEAPMILMQYPEQELVPLDISKEHLSMLHQGFVAVTQKRGGTAYWRRSRKIPMAGKTGTAQVVRLAKERLKSEEIPYDERDHAWFVGYAPLKDPQIVVVVINEHSGHGGSQAGPIAVAVIDAWADLYGPESNTP